MKKIAKASIATAALAGTVALLAPLATKGNNAVAAPSNGGTLTFGQDTAFVNEFIPFLSSSAYTLQIWGFAYDSLMGLDNKLGYVPALAKSWKFSSDHRTVTFTLQPNAKWSDGKQITSDDVLFGMNYLASKTYNTTLQGNYEYIVDPVLGAQDIVSGKKTSFTQTGGFKKINDKQFQITFAKVDAAALYSSIASLVPLPAHVLGKIPMANWPESDFDKLPTVVSGAFKFQKVNGTDSVQMVANPNYWQGKPHIANVVFKTANPDVAPGLLANGSIDFQLSGLKASDVSKLKQIPNLQVVTQPTLGYSYFAPKLYLPEFQDVRVRQAFEYALDRKTMMLGIYKGYAQAISGPLPSVSWAAATPKDGLNPYNYNPAKANQLLDAAGWKKQSNGWRIDPSTGKIANLHVAYSSGSPQVQAQVVAFQHYLEAVGVKITLDTPMDFSTLLKKVTGDDKSIQIYTMGMGLGTDPDPRGVWDDNGGFNDERWKDATNMKLIADTYGAKAFDKNYRKQALIKWQKYVNQQLPEWFLWQRDDIYAINSRVHIPQKDWSPAGPLNIQDWWVSN